MAGDGEVVARVASLQNVHAWVKAGVMIRQSLDAASPHGFMLVSAGKGLAFQRRTQAGGISTHTSGGAGTAPVWVKLARRGQVLTASRSPDGISWSPVGQATIALTGAVYVGLAVSSHDPARTATVLVDKVSVSRLPAGWQSRDVGSVGVAGTASQSSGTFTVKGAGADVWGAADGFHYVYRSLSGDGTIVAKVASIQGTQAWTKMGVMMRGGTGAGAAHAFMLVSSGKGLAFQRRTTAGGLSTHTSGGAGTAPRWVKLQRTGSVIKASVSADGVAWIVVGSDTISLPATILVGLVANSHTTSALATATFTNVTVQE
jgi:regulation of enolase protein 1 (concanavalin A-like superfamily)